MKKHIIILSAVISAFSLMAGCADKNDPVNSSEEEIQTETVTVEETTETTTKELVEIDPFEGLDFIYFHDEDGKAAEKSITYKFGVPEGHLTEGVMKTVQFLEKTQLKGVKKCKDNGCSLSIYREVLNRDLKEGDNVTYRILLDNYDIPEAEIPSYVEQQYGIKLTRTTMDTVVHFSEKKTEKYDIFEYSPVTFEKEGISFKAKYRFENSEVVKAFRAFGAGISYKQTLVEGNDLNDLWAGDKVKFTAVMNKDGKEYIGEEINKYLEDNYLSIRLKEFEKEYDVYPKYGRYYQNINVMVKQPDNWYEIATDKSRFTKYDLRHIDGSTATIPITIELVRQFCGIGDDVMEYYIDHNTTGNAYENLILGKDEKSIILVTEPSEEELAMAAENNVELEVTPLALDGFVFITHKDNPVDSLTVEQIQGIYSGAITNWAEVGGNDEPIVAYQREKNSGSQTVMENMVMSGIEMAEAPTDLVEMDMGGLIKRISQYSNSSCSIGYTFYYYMNNLYKSEDIKVININGVSPADENLLDQSYPFSSGYFIVTRKDGDPLGEEIKQYLLSDEGREIVKLAGYCPVN